jgi:hypothetical protein
VSHWEWDGATRNQVERPVSGVGAVAVGAAGAGTGEPGEPSAPGNGQLL